MANLFSTTGWVEGLCSNVCGELSCSTGGGCSVARFGDESLMVSDGVPCGSGSQVSRSFSHDLMPICRFKSALGCHHPTLRFRWPVLCCFLYSAQTTPVWIHRHSMSKVRCVVMASSTVLNIATADLAIVRKVRSAGSASPAVRTHVPRFVCFRCCHHVAAMYR